MGASRGLVGRAAEIAEIRAAARAAERSRGRLIVVSGEAGAGKTALAGQALSATRLAVMRGSPSDAGFAFAPIVAAVRTHPAWPAGARRLLDPGWLPFLRRLLPEIDSGGEPGGIGAAGSSGAEPDDRAGARQAQIEALRNVVVALARSRPAALVVDDLQRVDEATLAVLAALAAAVEREPLLLVVAYRSDELPRGSELRRWLAAVGALGPAASRRGIDLGPLDAASVALLAGRVLGNPPDPRLASWLVAKSGGLPLFVEELASALRTEGVVRHGAGFVELKRDPTYLPAGLHDAVLVRLEGLEPAVSDALAVAALAGDPIAVDVVDAALVDAGVTADGWLTAGLEHGVLHRPGEGRVAFRHDLVREVVAGQLPAARRRAAHAALAAQLSARGADPLVVAEHWTAAGDGARAVAAFAAAADASCRVHAYPDAAAALRRALAAEPASGAPTAMAHASDGPGALELVERLAECVELSGDVSEAAALLERAARDRAATGEWLRAADDGRRAAGLLELRGRWERAIELRRLTAEWLVEAGRAGDAAAERLAAAAHLRSAAAFTAARELLATALPEAQAAGRVDLEARIVGLDGNVLTRMGRAEEGLERVRRGLELALDAGLAAPAAELYQRLADSLEHAGDYARARSTYLEGAEYCRRQAIEPSAQLCLACLGVVLFQTGDWETADRTCREVIGSPDSTPHALTVAEGVLGLVRAMKGTPSRARPHLLASLTLARHIELTAMELISLSGLARCDEYAGAPDANGASDGAGIDRCRELVARWEATEERHYSVPLLRWAATQFALRGEVAATRACANALARIASETGQPDAVAALGAALGEAAWLDGDPATAAEHFAGALDLVGARNLPLDRAEIGWRAGMALAAAGRRAEGVTALVAAHQTARRLGAMPLARRIASDMRGLGEAVDRRLGRREARRLATGGLTRRELDVLRLVAAGHTSRSIGERLFISPRTAEMHVASAIAKLDCRTRAEAAHRAATLGLLDGV